MRRALPVTSSSLALALCLALAAPARAEDVGEGHGPGVGVEQNLGGLSGGAFVYDAGRFRVDVLFGLEHLTHSTGGNLTQYGIGGRAFFVVHKLERADLGLGGGIAVVHASVGTASETNFQIEAAAQIRAFITGNVALSGSLGFAVVTADNALLLSGPVTAGGGDGAFGIGGQLLAGFGVTYFFR